MVLGGPLEVRGEHDKHVKLFCYGTNRKEMSKVFYVDPSGRILNTMKRICSFGLPHDGPPKTISPFCSAQHPIRL